MFPLPDDYKEFMLWSNGGEGNIGSQYLSLWKIEDLMQLNKEYQIQKYLSKNLWLLVLMEAIIVSVLFWRTYFYFFTTIRRFRLI
ncbi:MAG: SMI1/KNR4 family protein [Anaerobutyricum soehngenii]